MMRKYQSSQTSPEKKQGLAQYLCSDMTGIEQIREKMKKSHSSFNCYEAKSTKKFNECVKAFPINEELDPWQSENAEFYGLG